MNKLYLVLTVLVLFSISINTYGQKGYLQGYVVTNSGEKFFGTIKDRDEAFVTSLYKKIKFKGKPVGKKKFSPQDIQSYQRGNQVFESVFLRGERRFLKVQLPGYMTLYIEEFIDACGPNIDTRAFLRRANEETFTLVPLIGFRKKMKMYFKDSYEMVKALENRKYRYRDLAQLVTDYNEISLP